MPQPDPTAALIAGAEQYLAELDDNAFGALVQRVRQPATTSTPTVTPPPGASDSYRSGGTTR